MKFKHFINADEGITMVISIEEYKKIKPLLKEFYTKKQIEHIDEYCQYKPLNHKFLLCNPYKTIPMMYLSAVTFVDRVPFSEMEFQEEMEV